MIKGHNMFYDRIYQLVDDPSSDSIITWGKSNKSFIILNQEELIRRKMLSRIFGSTTFSHFLSRLKVYGFKEIKGSSGLLEFGNKNFVRGQPELLTEMHTKAVRERCRQSDKRMKAYYEAKEANDRFKDLRI